MEEILKYMLKTLKEIKDRLIKQYNPEKIILFGSYNKKHANKNSDIDLLIIKKTDKRPIDRQIEVEKILSDREIPLDILVYTPEEIRFLFSMGSPFIEDIMEKGRLLYMRKVTESWLKEANEEYDSAVILYEHQKYRGTCYHCQQSVEKCLKAMIFEKGKKPGRVHDILDLLSKTIKLGFETCLSIDDASFLNSIYRGRYPTEEGLLPHGEPSVKDAENAISLAKTLIGKVKSLIV